MNPRLPMPIHAYARRRPPPGRSPWPALRLLATLVALAAAPSGAAGQLAPGYFAVASPASPDQSFYQVGGWISADRTGWLPLASLSAFRLSYPSGEGAVVVHEVAPTLGVKRQGAGASVQLSAGYGVRWEERARGERARRTGPTASLQAFHWGDGRRSAQAIASYGGMDGRDHLWSRVRAAQRVAGGGAGVLRLGAEVVHQGHQEYRATSAGPALELQAGTLGITTAAGVRRDHRSRDRPYRAYGTLELVFLPWLGR
jgi:hypothetical protein